MRLKAKQILGLDSLNYISKTGNTSTNVATSLYATTISGGTLYGDGSQLSGLVPTTRNLTINGVTQSLSADTTYTVTDSNLSTSDITTNNVSITKHGFVPKAPNDSSKYLDGTGAWSTPSGGGGGGIQINDIYTYQFLLMGA